MQHRTRAAGAIALLTAVLTACSGTSGDRTDADAKSGEANTTTQAAEPGKYRTLPEPCGALDQDALDTLLPGIKGIPDELLREKAYAGAATVTYDTDRRVGCRWKAESPYATHHLSVDFERVVSYDGAVSDDDRAEGVYEQKQTDAGIAPSGAAAPTPSDSGSGSPAKGDKGAQKAKGGGKEKGEASGDGKGLSPAAASPTPSTDASGGKDGDSGSDVPPAGLASRVLDDLGDAAFLDDRLADAGSASSSRTVTVVFRTSNVIVTIEYDDQPVGGAGVPDSEEMQDRAQAVAERLADKLDG